MPTGEPAGSTLNVGLFGASIKGKLIRRSVIAIKATQSGHKPSAVLACHPGQTAPVTS